jgi:hypothetical protein
MRRSSPFSLVSVVTLCLASQRYGNFPHFTGLHPLDGVADSLRSPRYAGPVSVHQDDHGYLPVGHILLVSDALVSGEQNFKTGFLGLAQQDAVGQGVPAAFSGRLDLVSEEPVA